MSVTLSMIEKFMLVKNQFPTLLQSYFYLNIRNSRYNLINVTNEVGGRIQITLNFETTKAYQSNLILY